MIALVLPAAWAAAVVAGSWSRRPAPERVRALVRGHRRRVGARSPLVERLGAAVLRVCKRPADPLLARRIGTAAALATATAPMLAAAAPVAALVG